MSDRKGRERELPVGYQFGDARHGIRVDWASVKLTPMPPWSDTSVRLHWRSPSDNAAERLLSRADMQWNQREGGMHS